MIKLNRYNYVTLVLKMPFTSYWFGPMYSNITQAIYEFNRTWRETFRNTPLERSIEVDFCVELNIILSEL